jgi:hypothetical protein
LVTLETAVTAFARIGYIPVVRLTTTASPPGVVIVSDPLVLTNDNHSVAVGNVPVDDPSVKARFGALEGEAILFPQIVTNRGSRLVASMFYGNCGVFMVIAYTTLTHRQSAWKPLTAPASAPHKFSRLSVT